MILLSGLLADTKETISNTQEAWVMFKILSGWDSGYNLNINMIIAQLVLVYTGALLTTINDIIKRAPKLKRDFSVIYKWTIKCRQEGRFVIMPETGQKDDKEVDPDLSKGLKWLSRVFTWARNIVAIMIVVVFLRFITMMV